MSEDLEDFLHRFGKYLAKANESKKRGNNDYNPLKAVQNPHDEVNMHSGFIYSLLDTNGAHYQDDLFLSLFLEVLGLKEWFDGTKNAKVGKEPKDIDLYIYNDTKHIIIENKINAKDQPNQIATLIQSVKESGVEYENIFVVFLTLKDREPCENSRTSKNNKLLWEIKGGFLESKEGEKINRVGYKKVLYENEILKWIEKCQDKSGVGNITNLNYALESYKDIVQIITEKKKSEMNIVDFFKDSKDSKDIEIAFEIIKNADSIKDSKGFKVAFDKNADKIAQELVKKEMRELLSDEKFADWEMVEKENHLEIFNTKYEEQYFRYKFFLGRLNRSWQGFGIRIYPEALPKNKGNLPKEISKQNGQWLKYNKYAFDYCEIKSCKDYFLNNYKEINKINDWLKDEESNKDSEIAQFVENEKLKDK